MYQEILALYRLRGLRELVFDVDSIPPTINHHHIPIRTKSKKGKTYIGQRLSDEAVYFRSLVSATLGQCKWSAKGIVCFVIRVSSHRWITKDGKPRVMDMDNRIKPLLDAVQHAIGLRDELVWHVHAFKVASYRDLTTVHIFDLG